ncbi:hypothetical protein [Clavibacter nebraskensis]|nr:hypothetical protein [Clavibacter nebraskensis]
MSPNRMIGCAKMPSTSARTRSSSERVPTPTPPLASLSWITRPSGAVTFRPPSRLVASATEIGEIVENDASARTNGLTGASAKRTRPRISPFTVRSRPTCVSVTLAVVESCSSSVKLAGNAYVPSPPTMPRPAIDLTPTALT